MSLVDNVRLLKSYQGELIDSATVEAAESVMDFLDGILCAWYEIDGYRGKLPRGYYYDVVGQGHMQFCIREFVDTAEQGADIFAKDVATGFLEELCEVLNSERATSVRLELGL